MVKRPKVLCRACDTENDPGEVVCCRCRLSLAAKEPDSTENKIICPRCQNTRYVGRTGVFELLEVTDDIRDMVAANASLQDIKGACRRNRMRYMQEQALQKVVEGVTGIDEVIRTTQKKK